jgi:hypothetical protein
MRPSASAARARTAPSLLANSARTGASGLRARSTSAHCRSICGGAGGLRAECAQLHSPSSSAAAPPVQFRMRAGCLRNGGLASAAMPAYKGGVHRSPLAPVAASLLSLAFACGHHSSTPAPADSYPRFDLAALDPKTKDFFALPWPTDLRRAPSGLILDGFPNPGLSTLLHDYATMLGTDAPGFAAAGAIFVSFSDAIDPASLPADGPATAAAGSAVFAVDLDAPGNPRTPLRLRYTDAATLFLPAHTLAALPLYGFPLAAGDRHALVVTTAVRDPAGRPIGVDPAMARALGLAAATPADAAAVAVTAPFVGWAKAAGLDLSTVALATVFKVQDVASAIVGVRRGVQAASAPAAADLSFHSTTPARHLFVGHVNIPVFQQGQAPYLSSGGRLVLDGDGTAQVQRTENVRFMLALPHGAPPAGGFPTVLYAHGTGGSYLSAACEGIADMLAAKGMATLGIDQVDHGPRNPSCTEPPLDASGLCLNDPNNAYELCAGTSYFNLLNPWAGRDNTRQGAADLFQLQRFVSVVAVPASLHPEGLQAGLNPGLVAFLGHSQGGLTGTPYVAAEPGLKAAVLSGTGGTISITLLQRTDPVDFKSFAELLLGIDGRESLDPFHPVVALVQAAGEPADPLSYGPHLVKAPLLGVSRHVMLTEGLKDPYTVAEASEALGAAARFDIGGTAAERSAAFLLRGLQVLPLPLSGNLDAPGGKKTGVLLQYPNDGHFAIFNNRTARCRYVLFLQSALTTGEGRVESTCTL